MIRRARALNFPIGDEGACSAAASLDAIGAASSLALLFSVRFRCLGILPGQLRVGQSLAGDSRTNLPKSLSVIALSLVEPEGLFVQVPAQVNRINTDVSPLEGPFQEAPEILDVVGVDLSANKVDRVVNHFMRVGVGKTEIGFEGIGVEMRSRLDGGANFRGQCSAAYIGDMHGFNAAGERPLCRNRPSL
jgi:hypothetical protein